MPFPSAYQAHDTSQEYRVPRAQSLRGSVYWLRKPELGCSWVEVPFYHVCHSPALLQVYRLPRCPRNTCSELHASLYTICFLCFPGICLGCPLTSFPSLFHCQLLREPFLAFLDKYGSSHSHAHTTSRLPHCELPHSMLSVCFLFLLSFE